ncbi:MAG TPA: phosphate ABC transporter permease PstA [Burkholderiaceae bacterium]|nr:phosphate ABC transporter permease PstA [Burkholderiaceae bacterium]
MNAIYRRRLASNRAAMTLSMAAMAVGLAVLFWILGMLLWKGLSGLSLNALVQNTPPPGSAGGLLNAIIGSLLMVGVGIFVATPVGVLTGIYLAEYGSESRLAMVIRFVNDLLLSAPSIVIGLFVFAIYVANVRHFSGWAGSFALALIAVPVVVRTTENMLGLVPNAMREASAALGMPRWRVITSVTLKAAGAGVVTGVLLALARISGETAPLLFTALNNQFFSVDMNAPMANLPVVIFQFAMSPYEDWKQLAWVGALLITVSVLLLSITARALAARRQ